MIDFYRKQNGDKDKEIRTLKKSQKKFAIMEKKLLVKEKAFEYERQDYHNQIIDLDDRVRRLSNLHKQNLDEKQKFK